MNLDFSKKLILENTRVCLEPLDAKHFDLLLPIVFENKDLLRFSPPAFGTAEALQEIIRKSIQLRNAGTKYPFAVFDKEKKQYAGTTSYLNVSNHDRRLEIGSTWIGRDFQRTGLNRNCKFLLLKYAFETLKFERAELKTDDRNEQSKKAILAIGAKFEGRLRSHTVMSDGFRRDTMYYSILKNEWKEIRNSIFRGF